jgi:hypothetical protein
LSQILTVQELIDLLAVKPNPLDDEGVSGLTIEIHPNPGQGYLFTFLALTYTPVMGLITRRWTPGAPGSSWEGTIPCNPLFIRSLIMPIEWAGLWELDHYHPPPPEDLETVSKLVLPCVADNVGMVGERSRSWHGRPNAF